MSDLLEIRKVMAELHRDEVLTSSFRMHPETQDRLLTLPEFIKVGGLNLNSYNFYLNGIDIHEDAKIPAGDVQFWGKKDGKDVLLKTVKLWPSEPAKGDVL